MNILILGAGQVGILDESPPALLAEKNGKILIERLITGCAKLNGKLIFSIKSEDIRRNNIDSIIRVVDDDAIIVAIPSDTSGAACTALLCIDCIEREEELLVINANEFLDVDYSKPIIDFRNRGLDAGAVSFSSLHPRYSFVSIDEDGFVVEAAEKRPISRNATAGFYWFRYGRDFIFGAMDMIRKDVHIDGRFYISLVFNELILKQKRVGIYEIPSTSYVPLKSRQQILNYEYEGGGE